MELDQRALHWPRFLAAVQEVIGENRSVRFQVATSSNSMYPFVKDGDVVRISPVTGSPLNYGDIVLFHEPAGDRVVIHRVVGKRGDDIVTKGDNCVTADPLVRPSAVIGKVTGVERRGRRLTWATGPLSSILFRLPFFMPIYRTAYRIRQRLVPGIQGFH